MDKTISSVALKTSRHTYKYTLKKFGSMNYEVIITRDRLLLTREYFFTLWGAKKEFNEFVKVKIGTSNIDCIEVDGTIILGDWE